MFHFPGVACSLSVGGATLFAATHGLSVTIAALQWLWSTFCRRSVVANACE